MFTRDSKILSHRLTTPLTAVANAVGDVFKPTYNQIIKYLFANNEQGFAYDPNDLTTMYQDAAGTNPVTTTGQPVGLLLDKSNGLIRRAEFWNHASAITVGESSIVSANTYRIKSTDGSSSYVYCSGVSTSKFYEVSFDIVSITGSISTDVEAAPVWSTVGRKKFIGKPLGGWLTIKRSGVCDAVVANISVKELAGNHAYQTISASRPILSDRVNVFDNSTPVTTGGSWGLTRTTLSYPSVQTPQGIKNVALVSRTEAGNCYISSKPTTVLPSLTRRLVLSAIVKANNATYANIRLQETYPTRVDALFNLATGTVHFVGQNGNVFTDPKAEIKNLGDGWYYINVSGIISTPTTSTGYISFSSVPIQTDGNEPTTTAAGYVYGADLRAYSASSPVTLPLTQEVAAGVTQTKGFPNYLYFDGVDDFLQTNNIDFTSTDKVSLFAGVRKLSDAATSILAELSTSATANAGAFIVYAPPNTVEVYGIASRGINMPPSYALVNNNLYKAPNSAVLSISLSTTQPLTKISLDGKSQRIDTANQGGGNYGNYPLYIGRRAGTSLPFNGHLYSLIGIGRLTTDSEAAAIEKELAKRTGVTLNV